MYQESVSETIVSASAAAFTTGIRLGSGMWTASPVGGTGPVLDFARSSHVQPSGDEGQGEHQQPDHAGDQAGAEVAAREAPRG